MVRKMELVDWEAVRSLSEAIWDRTAGGGP